MRHGFCIPIHGLSGYQAGISFAGFDVDEAKDANAALQLIGIYAFNRLANLKFACKDYGILTDREREVLRWTAAGKTAWDTGGILNIAEDTVNKHMASAMRKLNVYSRTQAVAKSIRRGKSFPDCQFRFLAIAKIIVKTNALQSSNAAIRWIVQSFKLCVAPWVEMPTSLMRLTALWELR